jgi:putative peptidoglycan lipid II flippase
LVTLAQPIIRLLFEHGKFVASDTPQAAFALVFLAPGLLSFSLVNILGRAFYALGDTRTPMKISIFCLFTNLALVLTFIWSMKQGGMGLANTLSSSLNVTLLFYALRKKLGKLEFGALRHMLWPIVIAGIIAGLTAFVTSNGWDALIGHRGTVKQIGAVFVPMTIATIAYWLVTLWFKVQPAQEITNLISSKLPFGRKV